MRGPCFNARSAAVRLCIDWLVAKYKFHICAALCRHATPELTRTRNILMNLIPFLISVTPQLRTIYTCVFGYELTLCITICFGIICGRWLHQLLTSQVQQAHVRIPGPAFERVELWRNFQLSIMIEWG
jgi:hypothetical protein